jgi:hypothetical protein
MPQKPSRTSESADDQISIIRRSAVLNIAVDAFARKQQIVSSPLYGLQTVEASRSANTIEPPDLRILQKVLCDHGSTRQTEIVVRQAVWPQPLAELRPTLPPRHVAHRDGDRFLLADNYEQLLAARDAGIEQVPLQHGVMLGEHRDDHGGIFRTLAFVDGRSVSEHQRVELAKSVCDRPTIKAGYELTRIGSTSSMVPISPL